MSATVYFLPGALEARTKARERKGRISATVAKIPPISQEDEQAIITRVLILQIAQNRGLSMNAEQHGFLHKWGHLAP